jgi:hypothetical protein
MIRGLHGEYLVLGVIPGNSVYKFWLYPLGFVEYHHEHVGSYGLAIAFDHSIDFLRC